MSLSDSQPMSLSHTMKRPRTGSYSSSKVVESEATESEAVRSLAARIPPELFENILFYVNVDRVSQRYYTDGVPLSRKRGEPSPKDILTDLKQCSLVCLFWANRCREHMFAGRTLQIKSYEDAKIFTRYVIGGCPRLTPVNQLIHDIVVRQDYESRRSFIHLLCLPAIQNKPRDIWIEGPVPDGFNPAKLDTPHWGIPPCIIAPSSFFPNRVLLTNVQFPSFYHIIKYIRHFSHATFIRFYEITWNRQMALSLPHTSNTLTCCRRPRSLAIEVVGVCTDSVHLALTALMLNPNCPLHRLSDEEHLWMIGFMTLLWGEESPPGVWTGLNVSEQATTMNLGNFYFVFEEAPATDRPDSVLSVVGIHAYIFSLPADFDALVNHARTHPAIRALVLLFNSFALLQQSMKPFVEVLTLATETIELVLAYVIEAEERKAVGVDLATLEPNGLIWTDLPESTGNPYMHVNNNHHLESLHLLQRHFEKKPRGRLH